MRRVLVLRQTDACETLTELQVERRGLRVAVADRPEEARMGERVADVVDEFLFDRLPVELHAPRLVSLVERKANHEGFRVVGVLECQLNVHRTLPNFFCELLERVCLTPLECFIDFVSDERNVRVAMRFRVFARNQFNADERPYLLGRFGKFGNCLHELLEGGGASEKPFVSAEAKHVCSSCI